ncbi:TonB-linked SusC/RagA family outer membrane protein [Dysgonomonas sp. PFB1-18]|uniref:SusC/RagA family TonB-linked outer membrane protein n=1 Tax=unclassified Dysgonomonas TaxID=2630389 RepID=UPI0024730E01|nr:MULTISPECIES: TonB-dependent receptor [unclassified Dysgonomonas]MDH6308955.1 TonB-linked SusC/RagA family outer membrane protein [Dysgonomonas sp. PF1-14]MDH6338706.1 TonB-linked SusC/RagA family outer membrane protein [Dysgonomonas sp. PF1-16]MDH6380266.1 TonB-linked SusC/RagA family outer membrane protein [Dysgonomonas sp. PFB1-18]MDH6397596.1 TonB-linked SusC/RagA family outer membrane protein [Dysgonomonas sp. PF1-23]
MKREPFFWKVLFIILPLFLFSSLTVFGQTTDVKGVVTDAATGETLIGVSVAQKGTTNGTMTDVDGQYSIKVPEGATLVFTYVGYDAQEHIASGATLNVGLKTSQQMLDEVVVVGYGVQKKSVVTASISKITADDLASSPAPRVDNALQGLVSGVQVTTSSGQPGASAKIRVRGTGTINDSDPLYIIDGMPVDGGIDYLNPADIASIEILKDAASGAVYGTRAANGVVLVTTKSGKQGKVKVTYDFSYGWQRPWKERKVLNGTQYATLMNEASSYTENAKVIYQNPEQYGKGTDWQKETFNYDAPVQNHQISVSGATDRINYYLSLGYYNQEGIVGGDYGRSNYKRMTMRSNTNYTLFDESKDRNWLKKMVIGVNASYSRINNTTIETNSLTGSALGNAIFLSPLMSVYADNEADLIKEHGIDTSIYGSPIRDAKTGKLLNIPDRGFNELSNPLAYLSLPGEKYNTDKFVASFFAELSVWDNLKFKTSYGTDLAFYGTDGWSRPNYLAYDAKNDKSKVWSEMNRQATWQIENVLTYDKTFNGHSFAVVLGQSAKETTGRRLKGERLDMIELDGDKANLDFTTGLASDGKQMAEGGKFDPETLASYFGRLSYNYDERYMLQFTIRRDGSSKFGPNNKWATFPSVSVGWNITNEKFMEDRPNWLTSTKLRLSWGKNGNEKIDPFLYTAYAQMGSNYVFGGGANQAITGGSRPTGTPNPDLKWEESEQYDAGLDFGFLRNSLTFSIDYFKKKTNGMLKQMSVPNYLGAPLPWGNVGDMENSGIEMDLGYKFGAGDWNFRTGLNLSYLKNKLIKLGNADGYEMYDHVHIIGNVSRAENGQTYPYFYGYKTNGIFQNQAQIDAYVNDKGEKLQPNAQPGDVIFVDYDNNGAIGDEDKTKIGKGTPDWTYGFNFQAAWKDIDFSMLISGTIGNDIFDATRRVDLSYSNLPEEMMGRWHGEGTSNKIPRFSWTNNNDNNRVSDLYIKNGSYMRLKNIQLGYTLPKALTSKAFISSLRVYVAAENLLTFTSYKGFDPEIAYNDSRSSGIDKGIYPQARTFTVGFNLNF